MYGESYVPIPATYARLYDIRKGTILKCTSSDKFISFDVKVAGGSEAGAIHAKQFQGNGNLKAIGRWYTYCHADVGDFVDVEFTSSEIVNFTFRKY